MNPKIKEALETFLRIRFTHDEECYPSEGRHSARCEMTKKAIKQARAALALCDEEPTLCPSCGCVVDKHGRGSHSVADCVFMQLSNSPESPDSCKAVPMAMLEEMGWIDRADKESWEKDACAIAAHYGYKVV